MPYDIAVQSTLTTLSAIYLVIPLNAYAQPSRAMTFIHFVAHILTLSLTELPHFCMQWVLITCHAASYGLSLSVADPHFQCALLDERTGISLGTEVNRTARGSSEQVIRMTKLDLDLRYASPELLKDLEGE